MTAIVARALIESARRCHLLDPGAIPRLEAATEGCASADDLRTLLEERLIPGIASPQRLIRQLAPEGTIIGGYRLLARLPALTCESWLASADGQELVMLRIQGAPGESQDPVQRSLAERRFAREAAICRSLEHPHLLRHIASGHDEAARAWFAIEYHQGMDLATLLRLRGGHLTEGGARSIGCQVAAGLQALSERGLVHRNLSPQSILIAADGCAKLGHFDLLRQSKGLLTTVGHENDDSADPLWCPPEIIIGQEMPDIRSDIYSLGCILYASLAGQPPYAGARHELLHAHCTAPIPDLAQTQRQLSLATVQTIRACMAKDASERPAPEDLITALGSTPNDQRRSTRHHSAIHDHGGDGPTMRRHRSQSLTISGSLADIHLGDVLQTIRRTEAHGLLILRSRHTHALAFAAGLPVGIAIDGRSTGAELLARLQPGQPATAPPPPLAPHLERWRSDPDHLVPAAALIEAGLQDLLATMLADTVFRYLTDAQATLHFTAHDPHDHQSAERYASIAAQRCAVNPDHLLLDATRTCDEWSRLLPRLPGPWAVPLLAADSRADLLRVYTDYPEHGILSAIDGLGPWGELADQAHCTDYAVAGLLVDLQESHQVTWRSGQDILDLATDRPADPALARAALAANPDNERARAHYACWLVAQAETSTAAPLAALQTPEPLADDWLVLHSSRDDAGDAIQIHLHDRPALIFGKLARSPVAITLRIYPLESCSDLNAQISRQHLCLRRQAASWSIEDLDSSNGSAWRGSELLPGHEQPLSGAGDLVIARVLHLLLRPARQAVAADACGSLIIERPHNRPGLCYVAYRDPIVIGDRDADIILPGCHRRLLIDRHEDRWRWRPAEEADASWQSLSGDAPLDLDGLVLRAHSGRHSLYQT